MPLLRDGDHPSEFSEDWPGAHGKPMSFFHDETLAKVWIASLSSELIDVGFEFSRRFPHWNRRSLRRFVVQPLFEALKISAFFAGTSFTRSRCSLALGTP